MPRRVDCGLGVDENARTWRGLVSRTVGLPVNAIVLALLVAAVFGASLQLLPPWTDMLAVFLGGVGVGYAAEVPKDGMLAGAIVGYLAYVAGITLASILTASGVDSMSLFIRVLGVLVLFFLTLLLGFIFAGLGLVGAVLGTRAKRRARQTKRAE